MDFVLWKKPALAVLTVLVAVVAWRWVLPVASPFLLGAALALAAEPLVAWLGRRLPRAAATGLGITGALALLLGLVVGLTGLLFRQLGTLSDRIPMVIGAVNEGLTTLRQSLFALTQRAPDTLQPSLQRTLDGAFQGSGAGVEGFLQRLPDALSAVLSYLTGSAVAVGTGCLAAYMISARLPRLRARLTQPEPQSLWGKLLPKFRRIRTALWGWLKAQLILSGISFLILLAGLLLLKQPFAPLWALFIAVVDAVPLLGTGTVLVPWALVCLLQQNPMQALGLLLLYAATFLSRTTLEPKLLGRQLGLDPLVTLISLYAGYRLWGIGGMLLSPILCVAIKESVN